jgi:type VI secretion system protein ImpC
MTTGTHCHILLLADFSGRHDIKGGDTKSVLYKEDASKDSGLEKSTATLIKRKIIEVDRDNFDEVFAAMKVSLNLPIVDGAITFSCPDDMHPDTLFEHISLFGKLKLLRARLQNVQTFAAAAREMSGWAGEFASTTPRVPATDNITPDILVIGEGKNADLLDAILSGTAIEIAGPEYDIERLARSIVAPFLSDAPDPRQHELIAAVDEAISDLMRRIMHAEGFQKIESAWQNLYLLTKRAETDSSLKFFIVDVSQRELAEDAASAATLEETELYQLLVSTRQAEGIKNFSIIMGDYIFADSCSDIRCAGMLAGIAEAVGGSAIAGGSEKLAGCSSLVQYPELQDWTHKVDDETAQAWSQLRSSPIAPYLSLVVPRVLSRLPYGKQYSSISTFDYEEIPPKERSLNKVHEYFLWGNGAWYLTLLIAQSYSQQNYSQQNYSQQNHDQQSHGRMGWSFADNAMHIIERLPLYIHTNEDGESSAIPCAEILMTDAVAHALRGSGLTVIRSIANKDAVLVPAFTSVVLEDASLKGDIR